MIQSYLIGPVALTTTSSSLSFTTDCIRTRSASCCGWLQHSTGSPLYKILTGGRYRVSFNANVTSATAGQVAFQLFNDGQPVPGTLTIADVETPGNYTNVSFDKVVPICCRGDATLTIQSVPTVLTGTTVAGSTAATTEIPLVQNANLVIEKIA